MKNILIFVFALTSLPSVADEVLSLSTVEIAGTQVSLPRTIKSDGTVCQSYIASSSLESNLSKIQSTVSVKLGEVCSSPFVVKSHGVGPDEVYPSQLQSMKFVKTEDGLGVHLLTLSN